MGRRTMNDLKILERLSALAVLMLWCVASVGAAQQKPKPAQPQAQKPMPLAGSVVPAHKHPTKHVAAHHVAEKKAEVKPMPARHHVVVQNKAPKKPVEVAKPAVATTPAVPTAAALADQTPVIPAETSRGRDPFAALIRASDPSESHTSLPPGIAGLQVATVRIQGMIKTSDGMVAVVANPQDSVYFLHDGDHIYDGVVEKIGIDDITFRQESKDAFGRTVDRDVSKRLYPTAGDAQ